MAYEPHTWVTDELITHEKLNHMEEGIADAVSDSLTVNGKPLSGNVTLSATDVGAVPTNRTINGKPLNSNVTLNASDVGALPITGGTLTGDLRIRGSGNYGTKINLGDGDYVHLSEPVDDCLELKGKKIDLVISDTSTSRLTVNGKPLINYGTSDLTAGSSTLETGTIYLVYK